MRSQFLRLGALLNNEWDVLFDLYFEESWSPRNHSLDVEYFKEV